MLFAVLPYQLFGIKLFPATGIGRPAVHAPPVLDILYHLIAPGRGARVRGTATFLRYTRASVLEVMRQDHVTTARSKGLPERRVRFRHILRNALLPVVTVLGLSLPALITGALFVETLFAWPGVGQLAIEATQLRDYPVIMAVALLTSLTIILSNLRHRHLVRVRRPADPVLDDLGIDAPAPGELTEDVAGGSMPGGTPSSSARGLAADARGRAPERTRRPGSWPGGGSGATGSRSSA